jgi:hypothetical protein
MGVFVPGKPFSPSLMFVGKQEPMPVKHLLVVPLKGRLLASSTNIRKLGKLFQGQTL